MEFNSFLSLISRLDKVKLGGFSSHEKMIPKERINFSKQYIDDIKPKKAAVLALFYPNSNNETIFLLILRSDYKGTHASQISFPGGKYEEHDIDLKNTALRETYEEVGVHSKNIQLKKQLTDTYIPPSNFLVRPFIGLTLKTPKFNFNHEVENLIEVKLSDLLQEGTLTTKNLTTSYMENIDVPCYKLNNYTVWGATAMILSEIKDLVKSL